MIVVVDDPNTDLYEGAEYPPNFMGNAQLEYIAELTVVVADAEDTRIEAPMREISMGVSGIESLIIDANRVLDCVSPDCTYIDGAMWVKFTESGSNDSLFTNTNDADEPNLRTSAEAQRGLSFSVEYDNTSTSGIGYSTTNIVIDAGDEWNSGQEISITLTDADANTNSLTEDDFTVTNADQNLPIIEFGAPFTLLGITDITVTDPGVNDVGQPAEDPTAVNDDKTEDLTATDDSDSKRLILGGIEAVAHNLLIIELGTAADVGINTSNTTGETHVANFDVRSLGDDVDAVAKIQLRPRPYAG